MTNVLIPMSRIIATITCNRTAPFSDESLRMTASLAAALHPGGSRRCRRIDRPTAPLQLLTNVVFRRQEPTRHRRQRRHFVGIQWTNQARRHEYQQFRLLFPLRLALEQIPDNRNLAENRNRRL